ncbi:MAG: M48 family metalloprotease [Burkholderiaceae bacterium]
MDFFQRQAHARRLTRRLVLLFLGAIAAVIAAVNGAGWLLWRVLAPGLDLPGHFFATNTFVVLLFVVGSAWLESLRLREGGSAVAHRLGARSLDEYDPGHLRLRNIVEELAIPSEIAVPELFVLDHPSINALTAGDVPARCAIVVTRGAIERLTRNELQGVLAHEMAHIVNGDAMLNTRLAGALYGLYWLSLMGHSMMGVRMRSSSGGLYANPLLWIAGAALAAIGWVGSAAAHLVQAGVSRQRELLADALAVQFTRDRDGLGQALRKIDGARVAPIQTDYLEVVAHLLLASNRPQTGHFDSHPPIAERVRRLYGRWMPPIRDDQSADDQGPPPAHARTLPGAPALAPLDFDAGTRSSAQARVASDAAAGVGALLDASVDAADHASTLLRLARSPSPRLADVRRLLVTLVGSPASRQIECDSPGATADPGDPLAAALAWLARADSLWLRVPLIELLTARVRPWPESVRTALMSSCREAVEADARIEKVEWVYYTLVRHRLLPVSARRQPFSMSEQRRALARVFALAGHLGEASARRVRDALAATATTIGIPPPAGTPDALDAATLSGSLDVLASLSPLSKPLLLRALAGLGRNGEEPVYQAFLVAVSAAIDAPPPQRKGIGADATDTIGADQ